MNRKYEIEKVLHEIIRDLPDAQKAEKHYRRGLFSFDACLKEIAAVYRAEMEKENRPD